MRASPGAAVSRSWRWGPAAAAARSVVGAAALPAAAAIAFNVLRRVHMPVFIGSLFRRCAKVLDNFGRVPLRRSALAPKLSPLAVYEQRGRNADDAQLLHRLHRGIDVDRERANADFLEELPHGLNSLAVDRERDHLERRPAQLLLQAVERRHLLAARHATRRPC